MSEYNKHFKAMPKRALSYEPPSKTEIKAIRKMYNLSQRCFAEMLDINVRTLHDYELGRKRPSQTATALLNFAKKDKKYFSKFIKGNVRAFQE